MKKITLLLFILAIVFASCKDKGAYTIEGNFADNAYDGKMVYLQKMDSLQSESLTVIDSAAIKDGKFNLKGVTEAPVMGFVSVGKFEAADPDTPVGTLILEAGNIKISFDKTNITLAGTPKNDEFNNIHAVMNKLTDMISKINPQDANNPEVGKKVNDLQGELQKATFDFSKANIDNKAGEFLFYSSAKTFTKEQLKELISASDSTFRSRPEIQELLKQLDRVRPEVGNPFSDVQLVNQEGMPVSLSDYVGKNKLVLVDFWASWCQPCIQEMPNLIKTYNQYKSKGLEIVGISVDDDKSKWLNAVKTYKMSWVQLADASTMASQLYEVASIPHTVLIDQNGIVVAKNLRGKALDDKIDEILK